MKIELIVFVVCSSFALVSGSGKNGTKLTFNDVEKVTEANINAYMDYIYIQLGPALNELKWVPMDLPDIIESFEARPIIIKYTGELKLTKGVLDQFEGTARSGNSMMYYDHFLLRLATTTNIRNIRMRYDYSAKIWNLGPSGWLEAGTDKLLVTTDFMIDFYDFSIYLQEFKVQKLGSVWVKLRGNPLIDWLNNALVKTVTFLFKGMITDAISEKLKENILEVLDKINNKRYDNFKSVEEAQQFIQKFAANGFQKIDY